MDDLSRYAQRPFGFYLRYVRLRLFLHGGILLAGFAAAICSVGTQYGFDEELQPVLRSVRSERNTG